MFVEFENIFHRIVHDMFTDSRNVRNHLLWIRVVKFALDYDESLPEPKDNANRTKNRNRRDCNSIYEGAVYLGKLSAIHGAFGPDIIFATILSFCYLCCFFT